jgi:signal peptidase I
LHRQEEPTNPDRGCSGGFPVEFCHHQSVHFGRPPSPRTRWVTRRTVGRVALGVLTLIAVWWAVFFRPAFLGGSTSYVRVSGTSMLPTLHDNDVVVVRRHDTYNVGDVVAYTIPDDQPGPDGYVIHRIVGGSAAEGYITRGDNRETEDAWHPTAADIAGSHVVTVPRLGAVFAWTAQRFILGLAVGAALASVYWTYRLHVLRTKTAQTPPRETAPAEYARVAPVPNALSPVSETRPTPAKPASTSGEPHRHRRRIAVPHEVVASRIRHRFQGATDPEARLRIREVVFELASVFASDDPDFDTAAFLRACGAHAYGVSSDDEAQAHAGTDHQR